MTGRIKRDEPTGAKLPQLGKIKIGAEAINKAGKKYPISLDYFRPTGKYEAFFNEAYGEKPSKIQIIFISDNIKDVCDERYEIRDEAGRLLADGDGEFWKAYNAKSDVYEYNVKASVEELEKKYRATATINLTIRFILPKIPGVFGQWSLTTKGKASSIPSIRDTFDQVQKMAGTIVNIPFDLVVEKVKSQKPGSHAAFPVVSLIPNVSQENLNILAEFVQNGLNIRGILTEDKIKQLSSSSTQIALPETTEYEIISESIGTGKQIEPIEEIGLIITKEQVEELRKEIARAGFKKANWDIYLQSKGLIKTTEILQDRYGEIYHEVKSGLALKSITQSEELTADEEQRLMNEVN